ncbi:MAG: hypothetical protein KDI68_09350 [Gammaproteobacteria bacterium]|nr:hypothetical protein [Gammaproteobacteria bacterium]
MKRHNAVRPEECIPLLPFNYMPRESDSAADRQLTLHAPQEELAPDLEAMRQNDPDSYRMVVYSWA